MRYPRLTRCMLVSLFTIVTFVGSSRHLLALEPVTLKVVDDAQVWSIAFSPKGDVLAAFHSGELTLWKTKVESEAERLKNRIAVPDSKDWSRWRHESPLVFSSDGDLVALPVAGIPAGDGGQKLFTTNSVQVWDVKEEKEVATLHSPGGRSWPFGYFAFVPNSRDLLIALDSSLEVWSPANGAKRTIAAAGTFEGVAIQHSRFLNDGSLVTARADGRVCLWDAEKPALKTFRKIKTSMYFVGAEGDGGGQLRRNVIVTSPDAKRAVAVDTVEPNNPAAHYLSLWDLEKGQMLRKLTGDKGRIVLSSVDWSADGKYLCWVSYSPAAKRRDLVVWDVAKNVELFRQAISKDVLVGDGIAFSPDSRMIATPAATMTDTAIGPQPDNGIVLLWDISNVTKNGKPADESKNKPADK